VQPVIAKADNRLAGSSARNARAAADIRLLEDVATRMRQSSAGDTGIRATPSSPRAADAGTKATPSPFPTSPAAVR
jgi:hypothetical protein